MAAMRSNHADPINGDLFAEDCPGPQQGYGYFDKTFADGDVDDPWEGESTPDVGHGDRAADLGH